MATIPSVAVIPSGYKASKLYSVLPTDGSGDFDFSRATTATRVNSDGLIETVDANTPRLNYPLINGEVSGCPSLLLEPEGRNLVEYSEDFNETYWTKGGTRIDEDETLSPDGTQNADKLTVTSTSQPRLEKGFSIPSEDTTYTFSFFAKKINTPYIAISRFSGNNYAIFNIDTLSVVQSNSEDSFIEDYGNGWVKVSMTQTARTTDSSNIWKINASNGNTAFTADVGDEIYIWGAQLEAGSYPTSYIPTSGIAITRSAETCNNAGNSEVFNDSEGVLYFEASALINGGSDRRITISDNSGSNRVFLSYNTSANSFVLGVSAGGSSIFQSFFNANIDQSQNNKIAVKYKSGATAVWMNGVEKFTKTNTFNISGLNKFHLANNNAAANEFYGNVKDLRVYNTALTDTELEELTTI